LSLNYKVIKVSKNGRVIIHVDDTKYLYDIGAGKIEEFKALLENDPDNVLSFLKVSAGLNISIAEQNIVDKILALWND